MTHPPPTAPAVQTVTDKDAAATPEAPPAVDCAQVTVRYGKATVLREVSLRFEGGALGLLGPNGAGKSTLIRSLLGLVTPDVGTLRVLGLDVRTSAQQIRARIGYMPENDAHIPGMNAVEFVGYCGQLCGLPAADAIQRAHEVLQYVGLGEARYRNVETYSTGMKQRIKLAQALVHDPDLLFLDEPTNGMDPKGRDEMLQLVYDLGHNKGLNLILSSHLLPDVEYACHRVAVLDAGRLVTEGPITAFKGPSGSVFELRIKGDRVAFAETLREHGIDSHDTSDDIVRIFVPESMRTAEVFALAASRSIQVRHLRPSVPTLEDAFARAVDASRLEAGTSGR
ncbi:MAG: ABC transporter ATP-binding protein [Vicinamibacterales bacterium]